MSHLKFADDIVVFATSAVEMNKMLIELATESEKAGLNLNESKTKIVTNGPKEIIKLKDQTIDHVTEYIYLGQTISFKNKSEKEIQRITTAAWKKYRSLKFIMKSNLDIRLKKKIFDSCIIPCLTYGCQTWSLTKKQISSIAVTQRKKERSMFSLKLINKTPNTDIRQRTKLTDVQPLSKRLKWKWAGHVSRMSNNRWAKKIKEWTPRLRKRSKGRPCRGWEDEVKQSAGTTWGREAKDREEWKQQEEAFVQTRMQ